MLERGSGSIVNIASICGMGGTEFANPAYHASKAGVIELTRQLAGEWADRGVRVNAISPGFFMSEMVREALELTGTRAWVESRTPMRRMGEHDELVGPLLFLASDASSYVTGVNLAVDGGHSDHDRRRPAAGARGSCGTARARSTPMASSPASPSCRPASSARGSPASTIRSRRRDAPRRHQRSRPSLLRRGHAARRRRSGRAAGQMTPRWIDRARTARPSVARRSSPCSTMRWPIAGRCRAERAARLRDDRGRRRRPVGGTSSSTTDASAASRGCCSRTTTTPTSSGEGRWQFASRTLVRPTKARPTSRALVHTKEPT